VTGVPQPQPDPFGLLAAGREAYRRRHEAGRERVSAGRSWAITVGLLLAGMAVAVPAAFIGTLGQLVRSLGSGLAMFAIAPLVEEICKALVAFWAVDRRPWWFRRRGQILLCTVGTGLAFGLIENLIYQHVYFALAVDGKAMTATQVATVMAFRWPVTTAVHVVTAAASGIWLARVWSRAEAERAQPRIGTGIGWFVGAVSVHTAYNVLATILELAGSFD